MPKPFISFYYGQSLMPPGQKGQTVGSGVWMECNGQWYRVEVTSSTFKVLQLISNALDLREWPWKEGE